MIAGFQGEQGAFSEQAAAVLTGGAQSRGFSTFAGVVDALRNGAITHAVLPFENSLHGPIAAVQRLIREDPSLRIAGETSLAIEQCLLVLPGVTLEEIDTVTSHPVALAQCSRFLREHSHWRAVESHDTAGAVREMMERSRRSTAAIGPAAAAQRYGARLLMRGIADDAENVTRFWLIVRS